MICDENSRWLLAVGFISGSAARETFSDYKDCLQLYAFSCTGSGAVARGIGVWSFALSKDIKQARPYEHAIVPTLREDRQGH